MIFAAWRTPGIFKADAQRVYEEITAIGDSATTKQILDKARDGRVDMEDIMYRVSNKNPIREEVG